jgi:hypothetical protein
LVVRLAELNLVLAMKGNSIVIVPLSVFVHFRGHFFSPDTFGQKSAVRHKPTNMPHTSFLPTEHRILAYFLSKSKRHFVKNSVEWVP